MLIYQPREDSELLKKYVSKYAMGRVLDMGTGSGVQAIEAAKNKTVREVIAVDVNEDAIKQLKNNPKIKPLVSDLFSNVTGKFNLIIFNPPYLPQDKGIEDPALYGGKKGWELLDKFFSQVTDYLDRQGKILIIFSSLTNKNKVNQIIESNLFEFKELEKINLPFFEELYCYLVTKTTVLRTLESKEVTNIKYYTHGKRGNIFTAIFDGSKLIKSHFAKPELVKVAIKIKRKESLAVERIKNEVYWLKILNKKGIGPKLFFYGQNFMVTEFIEGEFILDWIKTAKKSGVKSIIVDILNQCYQLDQLKVNKEEMHNPWKHIIITTNNQPILLDFERCYETKKPHNVTQFCTFLMSHGMVDKDQVIPILKKYKENLDEEYFKEILKQI